MLTILQKKILFHGGCIPIRICLILLYYFYNSFEISSITFFIGSLFFYKAINGDSIGIFGSKVYWPRWFHSLTYVTSGVLMCIKKTQAYAFIPLLIDVVIGICVFWYNYKITLPEKEKRKEKEAIDTLLKNF